MVAFVTRIVASFSALDTPPVPNLLENGQSLASFFLVTAGLGGLINLVRLFTPKGRMRLLGAQTHWACMWRGAR